VLHDSIVVFARRRQPLPVAERISDASTKTGRVRFVKSKDGFLRGLLSATPMVAFSTANRLKQVRPYLVSYLVSNCGQFETWTSDRESSLPVNVDCPLLI